MPFLTGSGSGAAGRSEPGPNDSRALRLRSDSAPFFFDNHRMRLSSDQVQAIKAVARQVLGDDCEVILFGSRTDDTLRGGDIDLLFETRQATGNRAQVLGRIYAGLIERLGDQKIDLLLKDANTPDAPVLQQARARGLRL